MATLAVVPEFHQIPVVTVISYSYVLLDNAGSGLKDDVWKQMFDPLNRLV